jgi:NAD(P)-dependent dehydrogenase (short-subunit alcohol dehydrogenase family)
LSNGFQRRRQFPEVTESTEVAASKQIALVDGHIGEPVTTAKIVETALSRFKSIDVLVNNAGIFFSKPSTDYTVENFKSLVSTNVEDFLYVFGGDQSRSVTERKEKPMPTTVTKVLSVNVGRAREFDYNGRPAKSAIWKLPTASRIAARGVNL